MTDTIDPWIEPRKLDQTEFGENGNCQSACLAMLLGLHISQVPNFTLVGSTDEEHMRAQAQWLEERGWALSTVVKWQALPWPPPRGYYIAGGVSPRGHRHAVIYKDGQLWHDPHPDRGGIAEVQDVDLLVPIHPHLNRRHERRTLIGVGMPASMYLDEFGSQVWSAFGQPPYLVGSAAVSKKWRDVDVRLILEDEVYAALGLGDVSQMSTNGKWASLCLAYSALGKQITGLPIDFQIQQQTWANKKYGGVRHPLGFIELRYKR